MLAFRRVAWLLASLSLAAQHMKLDPVQWVSKRDSSLPLWVENYCGEIIYPAVLTQAGTGPSISGFKLNPGDSQRLTGRTNCTFNADGTGPNPPGGPNGNGAACSTGDCGGVVKCTLAGWPPATLAEFNLKTSSGQAFYDLSLVDGYNLPMGVFNLFNETNDPNLQDIPPNLTNPICIGSPALITNPSNAPDKYLGTNKTYPIPLEQQNSRDDVSKWCPWDLQVMPPSKPADGVYPYPDDSIDRPAFDPCYSACAKSGAPADCCTGSHGSPSTCQPSTYSKNAKAMCPDAYSYAYDDQTSTFIVPQGGGFGVAFCPLGRSSNILATMGKELQAIASRGDRSQIQSHIRRNKTNTASSEGVPLLLRGIRLRYWTLLVAVVTALISTRVTKI